MNDHVASAAPDSPHDLAAAPEASDASAASSPVAVDPARIAAEAAASEEYASAPVPADVAAELGPDFTALVHLPLAMRHRLLEHLPADTDFEALLATSWSAALQAGALRYYEEKVVFPLAALSPDGKTPIEVSIRPADPERSWGKTWFVCYVFARERPVAAERIAPSRALEGFAWLGPWEEFLSQLAAVALPEAWDFAEPDEQGHRFVILKSYLCTTFYRLSQEGKVAIAADRSFAAFNTGLVDNRFDDIYACFEPHHGLQEWRFCGFAASGNRQLKKMVARTFNPLPQPASYVEALEDLLFDLSRPLTVDYDHILLDNLERLPMAFLADELRGSSEAQELLRDIDAAAPADRETLWRELADLIDTDSRLFRQLRNRLEDAVDIARRRIRWNFKTAIPCYYPRANAMSLLLPLCLVDDEHADAALVTQLQPSGSYQGNTVLTMHQAYMNARLICRPDSDWLTTTR